MEERFTIDSDIRSMPVVEERLFHFCNECNVGNYYSAVSVATMQAVKTAIERNCEIGEGSEVNIVFGMCAGGIFTIVSDSGAEYDYSSFGSLPMQHDDFAEGQFVIHQLADEVQYSDGGRTVRLKFEVAGIDPSDAMHRISVLQRMRSKIVA